MVSTSSAPGCLQMSGNSTFPANAPTQHSACWQPVLTAIYAARWSRSGLNTKLSPMSCDMKGYPCLRYSCFQIYLPSWLQRIASCATLRLLQVTCCYPYVYGLLCCLLHAISVNTPVIFCLELSHSTTDLNTRADLLGCFMRCSRMSGGAACRRLD